VKIRGLEMIRSMPLASAAVSLTFKFTELSIAPSVKPIAPPLPVPTTAGRFTAKFGFGTEFWKGDKPAVGVVLSLAPPETPICDGKMRPVGLPVAGLNVPSPPH